MQFLVRCKGEYRVGFFEDLGYGKAFAFGFLGGWWWWWIWLFRVGAGADGDEFGVFAVVDGGVVDDGVLFRGPLLRSNDGACALDGQNYIVFFLFDFEEREHFTWYYILT